MAFFRVVQGAEGVPAGEDQPDGVQVPDESLVRGKGQGHFFFSGKLQEGASKVGGGYAAKGVLQAFYVVSDGAGIEGKALGCLLYTSPSPRDLSTSRMPSSA